MQENQEEPKFIFRQMTLEELKILIARQNEEGWDLCANEAEAIYSVDPKGFFAAELNGRLVGSLVILKYGEGYKYGTLYTIDKEFRGKGLGPKLFEYGVKQADFERDDESSVGESEYYIWPIYDKRKWKIFCNEYEYKLKTQSYPPVEGVVDLKTIPIEKLYTYDKKVFGYARESYLRLLLNHKEHFGVAKLDKDGEIIGYGIIKKITDTFYKLSPWLADNKETAVDLLNSAQNCIPGVSMSFTILDVNEDMMSILKKDEWENIFSGYRIYKSKLPNIDWSKTYGIGGEFH